MLALTLFLSLYWIAPEQYQINWIQTWPGLLTCVLFVVITELYSIDQNLGKTSLSTSAVLILAGTLLYGPVAATILSATYAIVVGIKYRSQFNKYVFNFSNQMLAAMVYSIAFHFTEQPILVHTIGLQALLIVLTALVVYIINTWLISIGIGIDLHQPPTRIWKEQYAWLVTIYIGIGLIATAYILGYRSEGVFGALLMMVPLVLLRISQKQYVDRTREAVTELREKNIALGKNAEEINQLNEGLLLTLSEIIDLRDPNVLGHSKRVSNFAASIAKLLGLNEKQIELIRKASLLHDIGKLGIEMDILTKPGKLTPGEYEFIKKHAAMGGDLVKNSPSLRPLIPTIRNHHEYYNGEGYPDKLARNQIPIEARIVAVADAVDAMTSDRPYRKRLRLEQVMNELIKYSGSQFDPLVVKTALEILGKEANGQSSEFDCQSNPIPNLNISDQPYLSA